MKCFILQEIWPFIGPDSQLWSSCCCRLTRGGGIGKCVNYWDFCPPASSTTSSCPKQRWLCNPYVLIKQMLSAIDSLSQLNITGRWCCWLTSDLLLQSQKILWFWWKVFHIMTQLPFLPELEVVCSITVVLDSDGPFYQITQLISYVIDRKQISLRIIVFHLLCLPQSHPWHLTFPQRYSVRNSERQLDPLPSRLTAESVQAGSLHVASSSADL